MGGLGAWPALVAVAHALTHRAARVVLATPALMAALEHEHEGPLMLWLAGLDHLADAGIPSGRVLAPLPDGATPDDVRALVARGVVPIAGRGRWVPPGQARAVAMTAAALALPLHHADTRQLLPTAELERTPLDPALAEAGAEALAVYLGRVMLATGRAPLAGPAPAPTASPVRADPLASALEALVQAHTFKHPPGPAGLLTLRREAQRILREAVLRRSITGFALDVHDEDGTPVIEVAVRHPKRVDQVILRIGPITGLRGQGD